MPDSTPATATDVPKPEAGKIPALPDPNPAPASTNALGTTTPTTPGTATTSIGGSLSAVTSGKKTLVDSIPPAGWAFIVFMGLWIVFGFAGFVMSLWCFGFSGDTGVKIGGLAVAMLLGPFYWVYFYSVPAYCARLPPPSTLF